MDIKPINPRNIRVKQIEIVIKKNKNGCLRANI